MADRHDWTGNSRSAWATLGASSHSEEDRETHDYYATDPAAIPILLAEEEFAPHIWEPACGEGHLSKELERAGKYVWSTDLIDRGYGSTLDFFCFNAPLRGDMDIITNPPYSKAQEFVEHALALLADGRKCAMLLRIQFLETVRRRALFENHPPHTVYVFSKRISCAKNGDFEKHSRGAVCYAWFVWRKGWHGSPQIRWVN